MINRKRDIINAVGQLMQIVADEVRDCDYAREHFNHTVNEVMSTMYQNTVEMKIQPETKHDY